MALAHSRRPSMAGFRGVHGRLPRRPWPASEASAANHHHGDSFGGQYRYEPSPNILQYTLNANQKVELLPIAGTDTGGIDVISLYPVVIDIEDGIFHPVVNIILIAGIIGPAGGFIRPPGVILGIGKA